MHYIFPTCWASSRCTCTCPETSQTPVPNHDRGTDAMHTGPDLCISTFTCSCVTNCLAVSQRLLQHQPTNTLYRQLLQICMTCPPYTALWYLKDKASVQLDCVSSSLCCALRWAYGSAVQMAIHNFGCCSTMVVESSSIFAARVPVWTTRMALTGTAAFSSQLSRAMTALDSKLLIAETVASSMLECPV